MTVARALSSTHPYDWMDDVIYILDANGHLAFANTYTLRQWEKQLHEVVGRPLEEVLPYTPAKELQNTFRHALSAQQRTEFDTFGMRERGWLNITLHPHEGGLIVHIRPLARTSGINIPEQLDALTGCLTRAAFQTALNVIDETQVLAIVDLNRLKSVNTLRGHSGGDTYIRTIAHAVQEALPEGALMCRWGGDEFVILIHGTDREELYALLEGVEKTLPGPAQDVTAYAVGFAIWEAGTPFERAFAIADEHLHLRKEQLQERDSAAADDSLVTFSQELEALCDPGDLIQHALNRLLDLLDFDQAVYAPWEGNDNYVSHQATRPGGPPLQPPLGVRVPIAQSGLAQHVQRTRTTAWSTDYPSEVDTIPVVLQNGVRSVIVAPVFSQGQIIATIVLRAMYRWQTITPKMRKIVELTALRLEHALELRRAVGEIRSTLEAGMLTLGLILEARDSDTQGHTTRATLLTQQLGARLGLDARQIDHLRQGAYLHDLGKLSIPDTILQKPGRLTPQEWTVMQGHVMKGYELATHIPGLPQGVLDVIRSHHERWNGTGYPDGLSGNDIPLNARIFAICDVYDALTSDRPYKKAWTHEEAVAEIARQSGQHFDPEVVREFLHLIQNSGQTSQQPDGN